MPREPVDVTMAVEQGQPGAVVSLAKQETGSDRVGLRHCRRKGSVLGTE